MVLCLLASIVVGVVPTVWYGPKTVTASIPFSGDPYDPEENDVQVDFVGAHGATFNRLAYFVGDGKFAATLAAPIRGKYTARFILNGKEALVQKDAVDLETKLPHGYIGLKGRRFAWSDGTPYFPIGYDYGWAQGNETVVQGITKLGGYGGNWSRIWACAWDGKCPWWPEGGHKLEGRELRQGPLQTWDGIVQAAEKAGVSFQFVLFHHGQFSTTVNPNWGESPWNAANGGFLKDPTDFFIDPEARRRTKIWLRYAVARYAASAAIMAWELFNEVQWVDAVKKNPDRVGDVAAWHKEMTAYVKSIDPYHHLVTSSSSESLDSGIFDAVDYMQPHTYPSNVLASISGYAFPGKPGFFGEFGPPSGGPDFDRHVRDGIYGGMLAGDAGCGEFWSWDQIDRRNLGPSYRAAREVVDQSGLLTHPDAKSWALKADTPGRGDLVLAPGGGWEQSTVNELDLPDVDTRSLSGWAPYFQSLDGAHKEWAKPFVVKFTAKEPGKMQVHVGEISGGGGTLTVWVNDTRVFQHAYSGGSRRNSPVSVDFPAGLVTVRMENHGSDWIQIDSITVPGMAPTATAHGMGNSGWALIRVFGSDTSQVTVSGVGLKDGVYRATVFDAATGDKSSERVRVLHEAIELKGLPGDAVLALSR